MCKKTLGLRYGIGSKPRQTNNCVKYYPDLSKQWKVRTRQDTNFGYACTVTLTWWYDLGLGSRHILVSWTKILWNIVQIRVSSEKNCPDTRFGYVCTLTLKIQYYLGLRSGYTHWSWTTIVWNIIQIQASIKKLWTRTPIRTDVWKYRNTCVHCDLDLGDMILFQGHDRHILGPWTRVVWNIIQVQASIRKLWPGHYEQTDRQTGWSLYTPNIVCEGICIYERVNINRKENNGLDKRTDRHSHTRTYPVLTGI